MWFEFETELNIFCLMITFVIPCLFSDVNSNEYEFNDDAGISVEANAEAATDAGVVLQVQGETTNTQSAESVESVNIEKADKEEEDNCSYVNTTDKPTGQGDDSVAIENENKVEGSSKTESEQIELEIHPNHEYDEVYEGQKSEEVRNKTVPHQNYDEVCIEKSKDSNNSVHEIHEDTNSNTDSHSVEIHDPGNEVRNNNGCLNSEPQPQEASDCYADVEVPSPGSTTEKSTSNLASSYLFQTHLIWGA